MKDQELINMSKKEQIWMVVFAVLPFSLLWPMSEYFTEPGGVRALISGALGVIGGMLGFGMYSIFKTKTTLIRVMALAITFAVGLSSIRALHLSSIPTLLTCNVCGYQTLTQDDLLCGECFVELTEAEMFEEGFGTMEEFIFEEQIVFFVPDSLVARIDFYSPIISEDGYEKDMGWKPIVPEDSVLKLNREYVEFMGENSIEISITKDSLDHLVIDSIKINPIPSEL